MFRYTSIGVMRPGRDRSRRRRAARAVRTAICGALATALVAGCAGSSGKLAKAGAYGAQSAGKATARADRAVARAEEAVRRAPRDAAARVALGEAYLDAGRFESAAATFQDVIALGEGGGATALRLALAQIANGRNREAIMLLSENGQGIPAGDLGLALALAGDPASGVQILSDALRNGEDTPKLRQNLAYAYALGGRWLEARLMAAQDVPADKLDERLGAWAMNGRPEDRQLRVAGLLGVPVRSDDGQPIELALNTPSQAPAQPQLAMAPVSDGELPPLDPGVSDPSREFVMPQPEQPAAPVPVAPVPVAKASFASSFPEAPRPASAPVKPSPVPAPKAAPVRAAAAGPVRNGSHHVQLGSFSSPENAREAARLLPVRNPELKGHELKITPAVVNGRKYWRVSAAGFSQASAVGVCSRVRTRGGGCIAYADRRPLPGAIPGGKSGPAMARR